MDMLAHAHHLGNQLEVCRVVVNGQHLGLALRQLVDVDAICRRLARADIGRLARADIGRLARADIGRLARADIGRLPHGQFEPEGGADTDFAFDAHLAPHHVDQAARNGETNAGAFDLARFGPEAVEGLEQIADPLGGNAGAGVGDGKAQVAGRTGQDGRCGEMDRTAGPVVFDGIRQQIKQHLFEAHAVGKHGAPRRQVEAQADAGLFGHGLDQPLTILAERSKVHALYTATRKFS